MAGRAAARREGAGRRQSDPGASGRRGTVPAQHLKPVQKEPDGVVNRNASPFTGEERTVAVLKLMGRESDRAGAGGGLDGQPPVHPVPVAERVRRLPEALLFTAGYYASRVPVLSEMIRRLD